MSATILQPVSLPQALGTSASPTFANLTLTGGTLNGTAANLNTITSLTGAALTLATLNGNNDINLSPNGSGKTQFTGGGYAYASGNILFFGASATDVLQIRTTCVNPNGDDSKICGLSAARWQQFLVGSNGVVIGGTGAPSIIPGTVTSASIFTKPVTAIANAVATAVVTVTIPNGAHAGTLRVNLLGSLGAGGAVGANEASASIGYDVTFSRTTGVNAVAAIATAYGSSGSAAVAGAATCTITAAVSAVSGAVGAANTFTLNVTISRGSGSSTNHTCFVFGELLNSNATGITVA